MPPNDQQILFYPVDETFHQSSLSFPVLVICLPILGIISTWFVAYSLAAGGLVLIKGLFNHISDTSPKS